MKTIEKIDYKGCTINVYYSEDNMAPDEWDNDEKFLVYDHRDFCVEVKGFEPKEIFDFFQENPKKKLYNGYFVFVVYAYIHSGVSLSLGRNTYPFTCGWDTSSTGYLLVKRDKYNWTEEKAYKSAEGLLVTWNDYLSGNVYGYVTEDPEENHIDSCWGFYGDYREDSYMLDEARSSIDGYVESEQENRAKAYRLQFNALKARIRAQCPINYRPAFKEYV